MLNLQVRTGTMEREERDKITSERYADLIIQYKGDNSILDEYRVYKGNTINIIDQNFAIVHIPVERISKEQNTEFSISTMPSCFTIIADAESDPHNLKDFKSVPNISIKGTTTLIGYIDTGADYTNPIFKYADNSSKILSIWDQTISSETQYPNDIFYGTEFKQDQINLALKNEFPLSIVPSTDDIGHGTMLAEITDEAFTEAKNTGDLIPDLEYLIVKLKPAKSYLKDFFAISKDTLCYQENDIMLGIKYLITVAKQYQRPIAICIAVGTGLGSHDDLSFLNTYLSSISNQTGTAVVAAAGNEGDKDGHYFSEVDPQVGYDLIELHIAQNEPGFSMQIWGDASNIFTIDITSPTGDHISQIPIKQGKNLTFSYLFEETIVYVDYTLVESQTGDQLILVRFIKPQPGVWAFRVFAKGDPPFSYHIWLPGSGFITKETYFTDANPYTTITSPGNATSPITVSTYNLSEHKILDSPSKGYTRANVIKPELVVPCLNFYESSESNEVKCSLSTSVSAAYATGIVALLLDWGIIRGNYPTLNSFEIKKLLVRGALRSPDITYPNQELGYGILNIYKTFEKLNNVD